MKHPFQILRADKSGQHLFALVKNHLYVFELPLGKVLGLWIDTVDQQTVQAQKFKERLERQGQQPSKKQKISRNGEPKVPKVPTPGPGAPVIYNYIRTVSLSRDEKKVICTTDSDKAVAVLEINYENPNCLQLLKRQVMPKRPCAISTCLDDKNIVIADKFGDVYSIEMTGSAVPEKELVPILGHVSMLSEVLVAAHGESQFVLTGDRDEHIKISHYPQSFVVKHWLFGHGEFVSTLHLCSFNSDILVSGGGDDYLAVWNWYENRQLAQIPLRQHIQKFLTDAHFPPERFLEEDSPKEISISSVASYVSEGSNYLAVLVENVKCILVFKVLKEYVVTHEQTFVLEKPIVAMTLSGSQVVLALDSEDNDLLQFCQIDNGKLSKNTSISQEEFVTNNDCEATSRDEFYPLYYISTLRKRSEH